MGQAILSDGHSFKPHSVKQDQAIFSTKPITVAATGIQFGKTVIGAWRMKIAIHQSTDSSDAFLICAPTYKIMSQSSLPAFLEIMRGFGVFSKGDMVFTMHTGQKVYFRTGTDPDSIVGITNIRHVWGDEAGLFSLYFWENMQARAAFRQAPITLTTSPYTLNWIYKEIIRPILKEGEQARPDALLIRARSDENPYFPKEYYEQKRNTMDPRRFQMMFGGEWSKFAGLVYDCFDDDENQCEPFQLPAGTRFFAGVDWGTTNPFAVVVRAITPNGDHYQPCEVYEVGLTITDMVESCRLLKNHYGVELFYCDPSQPGYIEEFNRAGLTAVGANNDIRHGIDIHYELLRSRRLKLFRGRNRYSLDEMAVYRYPDDEDQRGPNQDHRERLPVKRDDHTCLAKGTLIETTRGMVAIERIKPGDLVRTPFGFNRVSACGLTGFRKTITVGPLRCTEDHPIFDGKGFIAARYCSNVTLCVSMATNTFYLSVIGGALALLIRLRFTSIEQFGSIITALFLRVTTSIIGTVTQAIMRLKISNASTVENMLGFTVLTYPRIDLERHEKTWQKRSNLLKSGTDRLRVGSGTKSIGKTRSVRSRLRILTASNAVPSLNQRAQKQSFARIIASRLIGAKQALITRLESVPFAAPLIKLIGTHEIRPVLTTAVECSQKEPVYNLTIDGVGCFYANGVLVSNCDASRYVSVGTYRQLAGMPAIIADSIEKPTQETYEQRMARLTSRKDFSITEEW